MKHGTLATIALLILLLAGCGTTPADPSTPPPSSSTTTTKPPPNDLATIQDEDTTQYRIDERPTNATVRVFHTEAQRADFLDSCPGGPGHGITGGQEFYSVLVWNRTGLVHFMQKPVYPTSKYPLFDYSFQLPQDPPFFVWAGGTCIGSFSLQLHTKQWHRTVTGRGDKHRDLPGAIDELTEPVVEVRIPPGQLEGDGYVTTGAGDLYLIELQPISGSWTKEGQTLGDVYTIAPDQNQTGTWFMHSWYNVIDSGWEETRGETAMPGTYRYHVKLAAPTVVETVWRGRMYAYSFQSDELAREGFQVPFRLYDDHTAR